MSDDDNYGATLKDLRDALKAQKDIFDASINEHSNLIAALKNALKAQKDIFDASINEQSKLIANLKYDVKKLCHTIEAYDEVIHLTGYKEPFADKVVINGNIRIKGNENIDGNLRIFGNTTFVGGMSGVGGLDARPPHS